MVVLNLPVHRNEIWNQLSNFSLGRRGNWAETLRLGRGPSGDGMGEIRLGETVVGEDLNGMPHGIDLRVIMAEQRGQFVLRWNNPEVRRRWPGVYHEDLVPDREKFDAVRSGWMYVVDASCVKVRK